VNALRLLRSLRRRTDKTITYGNHMSVHMAIGILCMGGGAYTFDNSRNSSIASLIGAFMPPQYPRHTSDQQYHLQALRHVYVLAVDKRRVISAMDVDTREHVHVPLTVILKYSKQKQQQQQQQQQQQVYMTPCLVPQLSHIQQLQINSPQYYPITLQLRQQEEQQQQHKRSPIAKHPPATL